MLNKIIQGDSGIIVGSLPDNCIDLTVTSPPYDNLRSYNGFTFDFARIAKELYRVTKKGGVLVWVVGDATQKGSETGTSFRQALYFKEIGFNLHDTMIYAKLNYVPLTHNRYEQQFEYMFVFAKGKLKTFNPLMVECKTAGTKRNRTKSNKEVGSSVRNRDEITVTKKYKQKPNIWFYSVSSTRFDHPAIFPEQLATDHILSWSNAGDTVLDPFAGSGTTLVAAKKNNRNFIGIDISKEYCEIVNRRLFEL